MYKSNWEELTLAQRHPTTIAMKRSKTPAIFFLYGAITLFTSGCIQNSCPEAEQVVQLEAQNSALMAEVKLLKEQLAIATPDEAEENSRSVPGESDSKPDATSFSDLDEALPTTAYVRDLNALGVFDEIGSEFQPYEPITRAEYITWLFKAQNAITEKDNEKIRLDPNFDPKFSDIDSSHPAFKYVASLAKAGYSVGYEDGTFKPDELLTREEMIVIKVGVDVGKTIKPDINYMNYLWKFSDGDQVDSRYTGYIATDHGLRDPNILRAFGKLGTFEPQEPVLRHEAAATLWSFYKFPSNAAEALAE